MQFSSLHVSFPQLGLFNNVCTNSYALNRWGKVLITLHWGNSAKASGLASTDDWSTGRPHQFLRERSEHFRLWNSRARYEVARGRPSSFFILNQTKKTLLKVYKSTTQRLFTSQIKATGRMIIVSNVLKASIQVVFKRVIWVPVTWFVNPHSARSTFNIIINNGKS